MSLMYRVNNGLHYFRNKVCKQKIGGIEWTHKAALRGPHFQENAMRYIILAFILISYPAFATGGFVGGTGGVRPAPRPKPVVEVKKDSRLTRDEAMSQVVKHAKLLDAIQAVETGAEADPAHAVGDHGSALGYLQIHQSYYDDAKFQARENFIKIYKVTCADRDLSRMCAVLMWSKYPKAKNDRDLALLHHYGPSALPGSSKHVHDPDGYWEKVKKNMK